MYQHPTTPPHLVAPHERDALEALADADVHLAGLATGETEAEKRLRARIAAHQAQLEKLRSPWAPPGRRTQAAVERIAVRLSELTDALGEVEKRQAEAFREALAEARVCVVAARKAARVDAVFAEQFRRQGGEPLRLVV